jgi:hypothetical protein
VWQTGHFAVTVNIEEHSSTLKLKAAGSSQMLIPVYQTIWSHTSEKNNSNDTSSNRSVTIVFTASFPYSILLPFSR